jgi:hypothetical protein
MKLYFQSKMRRKVFYSKGFDAADDINDLHHKVRDAVDCHFEPSNKPNIIRLYFVREERIAG